MAFLTWNNQTDADTSLAAVNTAYGCTYNDANGYLMNSWDVVTKSDAENKWGFTKPEAKLGKTAVELEAVLEAGYTELAGKPSDWTPSEGV